MDVLGKLCDEFISARIHGLAALGSTGKFAYLDNTKKRTVVKAVVEASDRRVPVIAGVASTYTADAVIETVEYQRLGVDGIMPSSNHVSHCRIHKSKDICRTIGEINRAVFRL
jgi:4-hydroxy-tetrahydrodipicolinate synthase